MTNKNNNDVPTLVNDFETVCSQARKNKAADKTAALLRLLRF
jgi:hypothetical protein